MPARRARDRGRARTPRRSCAAGNAVRGIDLDVEHGEIVALLGPNGAGKTSTVEILEGLPHRARDRRDVRRLLPAPAATGRAAGARRAASQARTAIRKLSGGQRRRLDLAIALAGDPELLFLDEPTTGFDPSARRGAWSMVRELARLGKTVLLTTHFMDEAQSLADRIAVLVDGRIVAEGTPAEVIARHSAETIIRVRLPGGADPPPGLGLASVATAAGEGDGTLGGPLRPFRRSRRRG